MALYTPRALTLTAAACVLCTLSYAQTTPTPAPEAAAAPFGPSFSTPTSAAELNQPPSTPGLYDLAGIGRRSFAPEESILTEPVFGVPVRFDNGVFVYATGSAGLGYNDNVIGTSANTLGSMLMSIQPRVIAALKNSGDRYTLSYTGNYTRYVESSSDSFNNHSLLLAGDNYFSSRSRLGWSAGYLTRTDPRGSTDRGISAEADRWSAPTLRGLYIYGADGAPGRVELEGSVQSKRYDNNRDRTAGADVDIQSYSSRFFARLMPKTSAVLELRHINSDYKLKTSPNDNTDNRLMVGVTWNAAAQTSGSFKVGRQHKNFDLASMRDASVGTWEAAVRWAPLTYSTVDLITGKAATDSTGVGSYVSNTQTTLLWNHKWAGYFSTRATLGLVKADYVGIDRADNTRNVGLGAFYSFGRNYRAGLEVASTRRNSSLDTFDFRRNTTFLSLEGTL